ncbi:MAG TPA: hypothetical protein VFW62_08175 [bacterium]|nr:hypothetical protein [bacterium]
MPSPIQAASASTVGPAPIPNNPTPETTPQPPVNPPTGNPVPKFQPHSPQQQLRKLTGGNSR